MNYKLSTMGYSEGYQITENAFRKTNPNFPSILPALRSLGEVGFILSKKLFAKRTQIYTSICAICDPDVHREWFQLFLQNEPKISGPWSLGYGLFTKRSQNGCKIMKKPNEPKYLNVVRCTLNAVLQNEPKCG